MMHGYPCHKERRTYACVSTSDEHHLPIHPGFTGAPAIPNSDIFRYKTILRTFLGQSVYDSFELSYLQALQDCSSKAPFNYKRILEKSLTFLLLPKHPEEHSKISKLPPVVWVYMIWWWWYNLIWWWWWWRWWWLWQCMTMMITMVMMLIDDYPENYWSAPRKAQLFPNAYTLHSKICGQQSDDDDAHDITISSHTLHLLSANLMIIMPMMMLTPSICHPQLEKADIFCLKPNLWFHF